MELTEPVLAEALQVCLALYNRETAQKLDLIFFKEAVHHAARLSRVLVSELRSSEPILAQLHLA